MKNLKSVIKSNHLNTCNFHNYTKMDYLVLLFILSKIQRYDEFGKIHIMDKSQPVKITAQEFADAFSIDIDNCYTVLRVSITSIQSKPVQFRDLFETDTQWTLITEASFYKAGYAVIYFNEKIWHHITNLVQNFTKYKLSSISKLETLPSIRLFELLIQFKKSGYLIDTLENIKFSLGKETYSEYKIFKRDVLKPAIEELNLKHKRLNVQMVEKRENRRVSQIEFKFTPDTPKAKLITQTEFNIQQQDLLSNNT